MPKPLLKGKDTKMDFSNQARELIRQQIGEWDLAAKNYSSLKNVKVKTFDFGNYHIDIQFNSERILSSSAKVDAQSIEARPCFLCQKNLPLQQRWLSFDNKFIVLVNPFPIFPQHLTIPFISHTDQRIFGNFGSMLELASNLDDFVIFYNGPQCGASAPDHLHFQAGNKGFLPIEDDFTNKIFCCEVRRIRSVTISYWPDYQRKIITLNGNDKVDLIDCFNQIYSQLQVLQPNEVEPMLNILASFKNGEWIIHIFPRTLHRPAQYFEKGAKQIVLSPAAVDLGGVLITPRKEDFDKITKGDVIDIFKQVCLEHSIIMKLINEL
jgi:ATP adenylyltransferase/5',5'''-P-1,P-4-tetraphosphate phosphorylase II